MTRHSERTKIIMVQYTNSTLNFNDWNFYFQPFPYSEGLVVLLILLCRLKIQLQKLNHQRNVKLIQEFQRRVVHLLNTLMNWCAHIIGRSRGVLPVSTPPNRLGVRFCTSWQQKIPLVILGISIYTCE